MKIIIIIVSNIFLLFLWVNICKADKQLATISVYQAQKFIEEQLDGGWGESFLLRRQANLLAAELEQEEQLIQQTAWLLRDILIFKKRQPGRLSRSNFDCYSLKINGSLSPRALYNLLAALRDTIAAVGVGNVTLGNDEFHPSIICPNDRELFAETTTFVEYLQENYPIPQ